MRGLVFHGVGDVRMEDVPDARLVEPTDAVVQTVATCVCGSDLWWYRDASTKAAGHALRPRADRHRDGRRRPRSATSARATS